MCEPMIQLNNRPYPWREGATVGSLMAENNYTFNEIIVKINGQVIEKEAWSTKPITEGDNVEMIHIFGGG